MKCIPITQGRSTRIQTPDNQAVNRSRRQRRYLHQHQTRRHRLPQSLRGFLKALMDALLALLDGSRFGGAC